MMQYYIFKSDCKHFHIYTYIRNKGTQLSNSSFSLVHFMNLSPILLSASHLLLGEISSCLAAKYSIISTSWFLTLPVSLLVLHGQKTHSILLHSKRLPTWDSSKEWKTRDIINTVQILTYFFNQSIMYRIYRKNWFTENNINGKFTYFV